MQIIQLWKGFWNLRSEPETMNGGLSGADHILPSRVKLLLGLICFIWKKSTTVDIYMDCSISAAFLSVSEHDFLLYHGFHSV